MVGTANIEESGASATSRQRLRLILVENDPLAMELVGELLAAYLPGLEVVAHLTGGFDTVDHCTRHRGEADAILMDMHLGDIDGPKVVWQLRHDGDTIPVLGMTSLPLDRYFGALRLAGGQGLCSKRDIRGIAHALHAIVHGESCDGFDSPAQAIRHIQTQHHPLTMLTPTQGRVMDLLARGITDDAIATHLGCSPATVRKHRQHALDRLGAANLREGIVQWNHINRMFGLD
ncbi:response regulator [Bifidobacterium cuniculi]|uniref:Response regulator of two-component system n=1 Tax=Bifidobacterium cuniculi TaxID=1688 RepID=A0A087ATB7_9BIFI|nr:response regulator transcription factor [Bifidobacterium cuniculi]KFI62017.1 response regulator of two-component system [Bifidobacterium cuniculi]